jgi:hypothetical protein
LSFPICPVCLLPEVREPLEAMTLGMAVVVAHDGDMSKVYVSICEEHRPAAEETLASLILRYQQLREEPS